MNRLSVSSAGAWVLLMTAAVCRGQNTADPPLLANDTLTRDKAALESAVTDEGVDTQLEILRLRRGEHPDTRTERQGYRLEFRFRADGMQDAADAEFQKFLQANQDLPERWFYRLAHLLDIDRRFVSVHFHVIESEYMLYFDMASRELVLQRGASRSVRRSISIDAPAFATGHGAVVVRPAADTGKLPNSIQKYFDEYFRKINSPGGKVEAKWKELTEPDYLALNVSGLKRQIIPSHNYWERLSFSIELKQDAAGWKLACYSDGWYASGVGSSMPEESNYHLMDAKNFGDDLEAYAESLLAGLKRYLEEERR